MASMRRTTRSLTSSRATSHDVPHRYARLALVSLRARAIEGRRPGDTQGQSLSRVGCQHLGAAILTRPTHGPSAKEACLGNWTPHECGWRPLHPTQASCLWSLRGVCGASEAKPEHALPPNGQVPGAPQLSFFALSRAKGQSLRLDRGKPRESNQYAGPDPTTRDAPDLGRVFTVDRSNYHRAGQKMAR